MQAKRNKTIVTLIFIINSFLLHIFLYDTIGDDIIIQEFLAPDLKSQLFHLTDYVQNWSSRLLVNPPIFIMMHFDYHVWIICDVLMLYLLFRGMMKLLSIKNTENLTLLLLVMLLYPLDASINYGMIVMSITYIWPATAAVWSLTYIRMHLDGEKIRWYHHFFFVILNVYASNKEELAVTLFLIYLSYVVYTLAKKRPSRFSILQTFISFGSVLFHLFYSGNQTRFDILSEEIPYTFLDKAEIGVTSTFFGLLCRYDFLTLVLFTLLTVYIWRKHKQVLPRIVSILLPIVSITLSILFFSRPKSIKDTDYAISYGKYSDPVEWFKLAMYVICTVLILWEIYLAFSENRTYINMWILLVAGFAGRAVIGFGNKGWLTSFERTYTFLYLIMLYIIYKLVQKIYEDLSPKRRKILVRILIVLAVFSDLRIIYVLWW